MKIDISKEINKIAEPKLRTFNNALERYSKSKKNQSEEQYNHYLDGNNHVVDEESRLNNLLSNYGLHQNYQNGSSKTTPLGTIRPTDYINESVLVLEGIIGNLDEKDDFTQVCAGLYVLDNLRDQRVNLNVGYARAAIHLAGMIDRLDAEKDQMQIGLYQSMLDYCVSQAGDYLKGYGKKE